MFEVFAVIHVGGLVADVVHVEVVNVFEQKVCVVHVVLDGRLCRRLQLLVRMKWEEK